MERKHYPRKLFFFLTLMSGVIVSTPTWAQWIPQNSTTAQHLNGVSFSDSLHGWAVGDSGIILHTSNSGNEWTRQQSGVTRSLLSVSFCDTNNGWATGYAGTVLKTNDGGIHWERVLHDTSSDVAHIKVQCLTPASVVILRDSFEIDFWTNSKIWKSIDSGRTWAESFPGYMYWDGFLGDISFISSSKGWACGMENLRRATFRNLSGGMFWTSTEFLPVTYNGMQKIVFDDEQNGWAADLDTLFVSTDGGASWSTRSTPGLGLLTGLAKIGSTGYASTWFGKINRTTDGGLSWSPQSLPGLAAINDLKFVTPTVGWVVGRDGLIYHTSNGGLADVGDSSLITVPLSIRLDQNYPNPFNPSTTISYTLPAQSHVTLKVFNVLGQEVATLVNGVESPGNKSVRFDGSGLPSGVYFYRLQVGSYSATKMLMIVK